MKATFRFAVTLFCVTLIASFLVQVASICRGDETPGAELQGLWVGDLSLPSVNQKGL